MTHDFAPHVYTEITVPCGCHTALLQVEVESLVQERAQLLDMVASSTAALAATASRCDELQRQQLAITEHMRVAEGQQQEQLLQLLQTREGLAVAAGAVAAMKRALADMQEAVPALLHEARRESEQDVYAVVAAVTQSMNCRDKAQNTELFNRAMQVVCSLLLLLQTVTLCRAEQAGGHAGAQ
jgi:hypothetical protein